MTHYRDLTSFSFLFPIPTKICLKAWKANKNTAKSSGVITFLSFCVLSGDNYLASHQAAPTRMLSFSMWIWCKSEFAACLYTLHLSTLNRPQIMMATKTRRMWWCRQQQEKAQRAICLEAWENTVAWELWFVEKRNIKLVWGFTYGLLDSHVTSETHIDESVVGSLMKGSSFLFPCWVNQSLHATVVCSEDG